MDWIIQFWTAFRCQFCPVHFAANVKILFMTLPFFGFMYFWVRSKFKKQVKSHHSCCHTKKNDPCKEV